LGIDYNGDFTEIYGLSVASITVGASNVDAFIGYGTPDFDSSLDSQDLYGFSLEDVDLGLGFFIPLDLVVGLNTFVSAKLTADAMTTHGFGDWFDIDATDITMNLNTGNSWPGDMGPPVIDFQKSFETSDGAADGSFAVPTGGEEVLLDYDGNQRIGVSFANADINIAEFVHLNGSVAFEKGPDLPG